MGKEKLDFDPYKVLGLAPGCEDKDVDKAYKRKALEWHPDKNKDRIEEANAMFLKVYKAYEYLKDKTNRTRDVETHAAKQRRTEWDQKRAAEMDKARKFFMEKLKKQEDVAKDTRKRHHEETTRDAELERLRREGAEMLRKVREAEERRVREEHEAARKANHASTSTGPSRSATLKAKWKAVPGSKFNYSSDDLHRIFDKHGKILTLLMGQNGHTAIIEFAYAAAALQAETETGDPRAPLQLTWKSVRPDPATVAKAKRSGENGAEAADPEVVDLTEPDIYSMSAEEFARYQEQVLASI